MRALLVLLAACSYERSQLPPPPPPPPPKPAPVVLRPPPIVVVGPGAERHLHPGGAPRAFAGVRPADDGIHAAHASFISVLATTDDGDAAVTSDTFGATRLWPALDGSLEPVAVAIDHPAQLAIARDGDGFVIGAIDRAGQLTFFTIGGSGAIGWQARVDSARPFTQVVAAAEDFAAITDDGKLATFAAGGVPRATFAPPPGERLAQLAVRGNKRLALLTTGEGVRVRPFGELGFVGEPTKVLPIEAAHAVLSPSGAHLAATRKGHMGIAVVELESGRVRVAWGADSVAEASFPIGFSSERDLWYVLEGEIALDRGGHSDLQKLLLRDGETLAATAGHRGLVWGHRGGLVISDGVKPRVLGYRLPSVSDVVVLDHGFAIGDAAGLAFLDDRFAERERVALPAGTYAVAPVDRHRAFVSIHEEKRDDSVVLVDLDDPRRSKTVVEHARTMVLYQPATHLYATTTTEGVRVGRYDPATDTASEPILLPRARGIYRLELPASGGVTMEAEGSGQTDLVHYAIDAALTVTGTVARAMRPDETTGSWGTQPPTIARHGALVASLDRGRLHLRDGEHERWVVPARGLSGVYFTRGGELIGVGGGLAHVDLATGALAGPRCGWMFGVWDEIDDNFDGFSTSLCDARE